MPKTNGLLKCPIQSDSVGWGGALEFKFFSAILMWVSLDTH